MTGSILLTGANRGLGLALARHYAAEGWRVLACCRRPEQAQALETLRQAHPALSVHRLDVVEDRQIAELANEIGDLPLDILLHNAGVSGPKPQGFGPVDEAGWLATLRVNVIAPLKLSVALVDNVARSRRRIIAAMGSRMGSIGDNSSGGSYAYRTSKAGVHMVMRSLAIDLAGRGVIAVALHPGWVRTAIGGEQAPLEPDESARGLARVLADLGPEASGRLWAYDGRELPW